MRRLKSWIIKKLGGYTSEEYFFNRRMFGNSVSRVTVGVVRMGGGDDDEK